jgi:chaperonin GroES
MNARVLVERDDPKTRTESGLYLPDKAKETLQMGTVLAAGPKAEGIAVGQHVLFAKFSGIEVILDGKTLLVFEAEDILGALHD